MGEYDPKSVATEEVVVVSVAENRGAVDLSDSTHPPMTAEGGWVSRPRRLIAHGDVLRPQEASLDRGRRWVGRVLARSTARTVKEAYAERGALATEVAVGACHGPEILGSWVFVASTNAKRSLITRCFAIPPR